MTDLTPETLAELERDLAEYEAELTDGEPPPWHWHATVSMAQVRALLAAAEERDRLREKLAAAEERASAVWLSEQRCLRAIDRLRARVATLEEALRPFAQRWRKSFVWQLTNEPLELYEQAARALESGR